MVARKTVIEKSNGVPIENPYAGNSTLLNLYLLGRIPFTFEAPLWCLFGSVLFRSNVATYSPLTTLLSCGLVLLTNVSINYANEYFDYEADAFQQKADLSGSHGGTKMLINGTFPRWVALAMAGAVQLFILGCIQGSRTLQGDRSSLQGCVLWFGLLAMFAAQQYVAPPMRLHYRGGGELISSFEISGGPIMYGYFSQLTTHLRRGLSFTEAWQGMSPAMVLLVAWAFAFELSRILVMHAADITEDKMAGKHTLVSLVGYRRTKVLYQTFTAISMFLAWNLVLEEWTTVYWMVPVYLIGLPIFWRTQRALNELAVATDDAAGKLAFNGMPVLVSLQTLGTPFLLSILTILFKVKV